MVPLNKTLKVKTKANKKLVLWGGFTLLTARIKIGRDSLLLRPVKVKCPTQSDTVHTPFPVVLVIRTFNVSC